MAWADTRAMAVEYVGSGRMVSGRIGRHGDGHDGTAVVMACHLAPSSATDLVRASQGAPPRCAPDPLHATLRLPPQYIAMKNALGVVEASAPLNHRFADFERLCGTVTVTVCETLWSCAVQVTVTLYTRP